MNEGYTFFSEGYEEGMLIGRLEVIISLLEEKNDAILLEYVQDNRITEYQRQQVLFYSRLGIKR